MARKLKKLFEGLPGESGDDTMADPLPWAVEMDLSSFTAGMDGNRAVIDKKSTEEVAERQKKKKTG